MSNFIKINTGFISGVEGVAVIRLCASGATNQHYATLYTPPTDRTIATFCILLLPQPLVRLFR